jgi:plastocyanin
MRRVLLCLGAAVLVIGGACGGSSSKSSSSSTTAGGGAAATVNIQGIAFHPNSVTIHKGETVQWTFNDNSIAHNVAGPDFHSNDMSSGTFSHTFTTAGTVPYQCTIHAGMTGTVIVQ